MTMRFLLAAILALSVVGCCSNPVAYRAAKEVEDTLDIIDPEYISLVEEKYGKESDDANDRRKLVESNRRNLKNLIDALDGE